MKTLLTIVSLMTLIGCAQHKCDWVDCPLDERYDEFSDAWCIQDLHERHPDWSYEDCEYVLFNDIKEDKCEY